ncbi:MAG: TMEM165/GDT1 family protein [Nitrospiraceae bacterium]|nr:TMEM165/GDT1 family protein [Nitrospiraceae bacterium]
MGDKSQLVCMTLAARYKALPVLIGASIAFAFLNLPHSGFRGITS